jgi:hypothetical protein
MATLLEIAKAEQPAALNNPERIQEEKELLVAYLKGELTVRQVVKAMGWKNPGQVTHWLGKWLRYLYVEGKVNV